MNPGLKPFTKGIFNKIEIIKQTQCFALEMEKKNGLICSVTKLQTIVGDAKTFKP